MEWSVLGHNREYPVPIHTCPMGARASPTGPMATRPMFAHLTFLKCTKLMKQLSDKSGEQLTTVII